jgi:putative hydrolase of the HAD superfamily
VLFDLCGVVVKWSGSDLCSYVSDRFALDYAGIVEKLYPLAGRLDTDEISEKDLWGSFFGSYKMQLPDDWEDLWMKTFRERARVDEEVAGIVKALKGNGYKVGIITNISRSRDEWAKKMGWYDPFDPVVVSCRLRMRKPGLGIFYAALDELHLEKYDGDKCLFFDNHDENAVAAQLVGLNASVFENAKQAKEVLKSYGIEC